jgi:hypothetical protein
MSFEDVLQRECESPGDLEVVKKYSCKEFIFLTKKNQSKREKQ